MDISTGLNSNTVYCTFQDSNGQMWFGTNDGLTTYDTYTFETWRTDSNNPYSIGNNGIPDIPVLSEIPASRVFSSWLRITG